MRAVIVDAPRSVRVEERTVPEPCGSALVRVEAGGICGTDLKVVHGEVPARLPVILGHEVTGRVEMPGRDASIAGGSRVVIDPSVSCGSCEICRRNLSQLCPSGGLMGRDADGGFAEWMAVPESNLHQIPEDFSAVDAVMLQVLSTCVHAQSRIGVLRGKTAAVVGLGVTGLLHVQLLAASGVTTIVGISRSGAKRSLAADLGASAVAAPAHATEVVSDVTGGLGADIVIESAGKAAALAQATAIAGYGARLLIFGTISPAADGVPTYEWYRKELTLLNTRASLPRDFSTAIALVHDGLATPGRLVTSSYALEDAPAAIEAASNPDEVKVMLRMSC